MSRKNTTNLNDSTLDDNDNNDYDDDDDDDDDLLLSSKPVFQKRKEKASETRAFNYLDTMLKRGEERMEQQARINDLHEQELQRIEDKDSKRSNDIDSDHTDTKSDSLGDKDEVIEKKRKIDDNLDSVNESRNTKRSFIDSENIDIDDEEYWAKLKSKESNNMIIERDRRRQNLRDAVDGIDNHSDDDCNDDDVFLSTDEREQKMLITGRSSLPSGTRQLFDTNKRLNPNNEHIEFMPFRLFQSRDKAMEELNSIIEDVKKVTPRSLSKKQKDIWNDMKLNILEPIEKAIQADLLPLLLEKRKQWKKNSDSVNIPYSLIRWLVRVAMSESEIVGSELQMGATTMVCSLIRSNDLILFETDEPHISDNMIKLFHIKDMYSILQEEFGFWIQEGPPLISESTDNEKYDKMKLFRNEKGLHNALLIWSAAFDMDQIKSDENRSLSVQPSDLNDSSSFYGMTSRFIAALCRSCLDPCFHSFPGLLLLLSQLLSTIFDWTQRSFESSATQQNFDKWIEYSAELSVTSCSGFCTDKILQGEMKSDSKGLLPLLLAVRISQTIDQSNKSTVCFFAYFACRAAKVCFDSTVSNWGVKIEKNAIALAKDINDNDSSISLEKELRIQCVVTAEVTLETIEKIGDEITRDGPCFLAAVDIAIHCEQIGIMLFNINAKAADKPVGVLYENKAEAGGMCDHFERMENLCNVLKKRVQSVLVDNNMMRVKELLTLACGIYKSCKDKASSLANRRESLFSNKQAQMETFLNQSNTEE